MYISLAIVMSCWNENVFKIYFGGKVEPDRTDNIIWYIVLPKGRNEGHCMRLKARVPADLRSSVALGLEGLDGVEAHWRGGHLQGPPVHEGPWGDLGKGRGNSMRASPPSQDFNPPIHLTNSDFAVITQVHLPPVLTPTVNP